MGVMSCITEKLQRIVITRTSCNLSCTENIVVNIQYLLDIAVGAVRIWQAGQLILATPTSALTLERSFHSPETCFFPYVLNLKILSESPLLRVGWRGNTYCSKFTFHGFLKLGIRFPEHFGNPKRLCISFRQQDDLSAWCGHSPSSQLYKQMKISIKKNQTLYTPKYVLGITYVFGT